MNDFNINIRVMGQATGDLLSAASGKVKSGTESSSSGLGSHLVAMQKQRSKEEIAVLKSESKATKFQQRELINSLLAAEKEAERWQKKDSEILWKSIGKMDDDFRKSGAKQGNSLTKILGATLGMHVALNEFLKQLQSFFRILLLPMRLLGAFALMMLAKMGVLKGAADYAKGVGELLFNKDENPATAFIKVIMGTVLAVLPALVMGVAATILYQQIVAFFATIAGVLTGTAAAGTGAGTAGAIATGSAILGTSILALFGTLAGVVAGAKIAEDLKQRGVFAAAAAAEVASYAIGAPFKAVESALISAVKQVGIFGNITGVNNQKGPTPWLPLGKDNTFTVALNTFSQNIRLASGAVEQFAGTVWRNSKGQIVGAPTSTASPNGRSDGWLPGVGYAVDGKPFVQGAFTQSAAGTMVEGYLHQSALMEANDAQLRTAAMAILQSTTPNAGAYGDQDSMAVLISRIEQALYSAQNAQAVVNIYGVTDSNLIDKINQYFQTSLRGRSSYGVQG